MCNCHLILPQERFYLSLDDWDIEANLSIRSKEGYSVLIDITITKVGWDRTYNAGCLLTQEFYQHLMALSIGKPTSKETIKQIKSVLWTYLLENYRAGMLDEQLGKIEDDYWFDKEPNCR